MTYAGGRLLTVHEAAEWLNVSEQILRRYWRAWGLTGYRVGRAWRFREHEVQRWLESNREAAQSKESAA